MLLPPEALVREVVDSGEEAHPLELLPATLLAVVVAESEREVLGAVHEARRVDGLRDVDVGRKLAADAHVHVDDVVELVESVARRCLAALTLKLAKSLAFYEYRTGCNAMLYKKSCVL